MKQGRVYMRQTGTSEEWRDVGSAAGFSVALEVNEPVPFLTGGFTFSTKDWDPEVSKLYYAGFVKSVGVVNNRGGTRKEEKHMGVSQRFTSTHSEATLLIDSDGVGRTEGGSGVYMKMLEDGFGWFNKADVPLIAHALFEKSGWPDAVQNADGNYLATVGTKTAFGMDIRDQSDADLTLARAIANLAAYNAWAEGAAEREAAEAARKREHDELRTSAIALEALALYNGSSFTYKSWDAVNDGRGTGDRVVRSFIAMAEAARAAKPAPKVGDRVRVSAEGAKACGAWDYSDVDIEGIVVGDVDDDGDIKVKATPAGHSRGFSQYVKPKYVTVLATAEDLAAEKAKAERDAGIVDLSCVMGVGMVEATRFYNRGIRATA